MKLFGRSTREEEFWTWFARNAESIRTAVARARDAADFHAGVLGELHARLETYHPGIVWELGQDNARGVTRIVISGDGNRANFSAVESLTSRAPPLSGWEVVAFRPRQDVDGLELRFAKAPGPDQPFTISAQNVRFHLAPEAEGLVSLRLFVEGMQDGDEQVKNAMFLLLDAALGEYDMETKVGLVETRPASAAPPNVSLRPLAELPASFDAHFGRK